MTEVAGRFDAHAFQRGWEEVLGELESGVNPCYVEGFELIRTDEQAAQLAAIQPRLQAAVNDVKEGIGHLGRSDWREALARLDAALPVLDACMDSLRTLGAGGVKDLDSFLHQWVAKIRTEHLPALQMLASADNALATVVVPDAPLEPVEPAESGSSAVFTYVVDPADLNERLRRELADLVKTCGQAMTGATDAVRESLQWIVNIAEAGHARFARRSIEEILLDSPVDRPIDVGAAEPAADLDTVRKLCLELHQRLSGRNGFMDIADGVLRGVVVAEGGAEDMVRRAVAGVVPKVLAVFQIAAEVLAEHAQDASEVENFEAELQGLKGDFDDRLLKVTLDEVPELLLGRLKAELGKLETECQQVVDRLDLPGQDRAPRNHLEEVLASCDMTVWRLPPGVSTSAMFGPLELLDAMFEALNSVLSLSMSMSAEIPALKPLLLDLLDVLVPRVGAVVAIVQAIADPSGDEEGLQWNIEQLERCERSLRDTLRATARGLDQGHAGGWVSAQVSRHKTVISDDSSEGDDEGSTGQSVAVAEEGESDEEQSVEEVQQTYAALTPCMEALRVALPEPTAAMAGLFEESSREPDYLGIWQEVREGVTESLDEVTQSLDELIACDGSAKRELHPFSDALEGLAKSIGGLGNAFCNTSRDLTTGASVKQLRGRRGVLEAMILVESFARKLLATIPEVVALNDFDSDFARIEDVLRAGRAALLAALDVIPRVLDQGTIKEIKEANRLALEQAADGVPLPYHILTGPYQLLIVGTHHSELFEWCDDHHPRGITVFRAGRPGFHPGRRMANFVRTRRKLPVGEVVAYAINADHATVLHSELTGDSGTGQPVVVLSSSDNREVNVARRLSHVPHTVQQFWVAPPWRELRGLFRSFLADAAEAAESFDLVIAIERFQEQVAIEREVNLWQQRTGSMRGHDPGALAQQPRFEHRESVPLAAAIVRRFDLRGFESIDGTGIEELDGTEFETVKRIAIGRLDRKYLTFRHSITS